MHTVVLGSLYTGTLKYIDKIFRAAVHCWINLPRDTPLGFFHAGFREEGLDIPALLWIIYILRTKRMFRMAQSPDLVVRAISNLPAFINYFIR